MDNIFEEDLFKLIKRKNRYRNKLINVLVSKSHTSLVKYYHTAWDKWGNYVSSDLNILERQYTNDPLLPLVRTNREIELTKIHIKDLQKTIRVIQNKVKFNNE
jgi:hypothetical protein